MAFSSISSDITPLARRKSLNESCNFPSTSTRNFLFCFTKIINCRISSSCLSFNSLCPLLAVFRRVFKRLNSILVGFTFNLAIAYSSPAGKYFSKYSSLILFNSVLGNIFSKSHPKFNVSSIVLLLSNP